MCVCVCVIYLFFINRLTPKNLERNARCAHCSHLPCNCARPSSSDTRDEQFGFHLFPIARVSPVLALEFFKLQFNVLWCFLLFFVCFFILFSTQERNATFLSFVCSALRVVSRRNSNGPRERKRESERATSTYGECTRAN